MSRSPQDHAPPATTPPATGTRDRIIDVAARLFFERGYVRATTRHIAAEAGLSEVTLFRHFGNKLALFEAVLEARSGVAAIERMFEQDMTGDYVTDLHIVARHIVTNMVADNDAMRLLLCDAQHEPDMREVMQQKMGQRRTLFNDYFRALVQSGDIRPGLEIDAVTQAFVGMCYHYGMHVQWAARDGQPVPDESVEDRLMQIVDIFVNGTGTT